jgi:TonB family protein
MSGAALHVQQPQVSASGDPNVASWGGWPGILLAVASCLRVADTVSDRAVEPTLITEHPACGQESAPLCADYIRRMHNRLRGFLVDGFLSSLDDLHPDHPLNRSDLSTVLEILLEPNEGKLARVGVIGTSRVVAFDVAALESITRAAPFGDAPPEMQSPDGNVYLEWTFVRSKERYSLENARLLRVRRKTPAPTTSCPSSEQIEAWAAARLAQLGTRARGYVAKTRSRTHVSLGSARAAFIRYVTQIHDRLHPVFSDSVLACLDTLPRAHPMNRRDLMTRVELILEPSMGNVASMGIVQSSGVSAFDVAALDSIERAAPFGPAPAQTISADGRVYVHWEFHRDLLACSSYGARPFLLAPAENEARGPSRFPDETRRALGSVAIPESRTLSAA